jgi:hypothetical protein
LELQNILSMISEPRTIYCCTGVKQTSPQLGTFLNILNASIR